MASVSIGVPVFNGAATLRESLECLRTQTFQDIEVVISDNCSTDGSAEIAEEFSRADPRFRLVRQAGNVGAKNNFRLLIDEATSDLFMWRSDDDLSSSDFVERLKRLMDGDASVAMAAPKTVFVRSNGDISGTYEHVPSGGMCRSMRIGRQLLTASPTWIYGLWRRDVLRASMDRMNEGFPYLWGWDPITLFPVLLDGTVAVEAGAVLFKRDFPAQRYTSRVPARQMIEMRRAFRRSCFKEFNRRKWCPLDRCILSVYVLRFSNLRVYRFWKTARAWMREMLGIARR